MKAFLNTAFFSALLLVVCVDDSSFLSSPETQFTHQSNSPNRVKLAEKKGMSVENQFSVTKNIDIELCQEAK
jgi:hypothetical protein